MMMVETTVNIGVSEYDALAEAMAQTGATRSGMISVMLKHLAAGLKGRGAAWGRVKYQDRRPGEEWRRLHVRLGSDEYEFFLDLKKVVKMSVSLLIAMAIKLYLDQLLVKFGGNIDNYRYHNYAMSKIFIGDVTCWIFYWGIPPHIITPP
jgi:hypothetical protein